MYAVYNRVIAYSVYTVYNSIFAYYVSPPRRSSYICGLGCSSIGGCKTEAKSHINTQRRDTHISWYVTKQHTAVSIPEHVQTAKSDISSCLACNAAAAVEAAFPSCYYQARGVLAPLAATKCRYRALWMTDNGCTLLVFQSNQPTFVVLCALAFEE